MSNETRRMHDKYEVHRTDRTGQPGGKHHGCHYFVLDLTHDPKARGAAEVYAALCDSDGNPVLAADLRRAVAAAEHPTT